MSLFSFGGIASTCHFWKVSQMGNICPNFISLYICQPLLALHSISFGVWSKGLACRGGEWSAAKDDLPEFTYRVE